MHSARLGQATTGETPGISSYFLASRASGAPLRIGVVVDGPRLPALYRQILLDLRASDFTVVALVLQRSGGTEAGLAEGDGSGASLLFQAYRSYDRRKLDEVDDPFLVVDAADLLAGAPSVRLPAAGADADDESLRRVRAARLDVVLSLVLGAVPPWLSSVARSGLWRLRFGDQPSGPPLLWETVEGKENFEVTLEQEAGDPAPPRTLSRSCYAMENGWSWNRNLPILWASTWMVVHKLRDLHERGQEAVGQQVAGAPTSSPRPDAAPSGMPSNAHMLKWLGPLLLSKVKGRITRRKTLPLRDWWIGLRRSSRPALALGEGADGEPMTWMAARPDTYHADPCLFVHQGQTWLFFEEFDHRVNRGRIVCRTIGPNLELGEIIPCLDTGWHLSYPLVFAHDNDVFMIPESVQRSEVVLYRCVRFPSEWRVEKVLHHGRLTDTTPLLHDGRWYFFTSLLARDERAAFGALFHAATLTGEWSMHPASPLHTDVHYARPAGPILHHEGQLIRPVQDGTRFYGSQIHFRVIESLDRTAYSERQLRSLSPWDGATGVHTYGHDGAVEAVDCAWRRPPPGIHR